MLRTALDIIHKQCVDSLAKTLGIRDKAVASLICDMMIDMSLYIIISSPLCQRDKEDDWEEMSNYWGE